MELFWKVTAGILLALILGLTLGKQEKDLSILLSATVCCITAAASLSMLEPVLEFVYDLAALTGTGGDCLSALVKIVGITLVSELVCLLCTDAGYASLGKSLQFAASAVILYVSIPIFTAVFSMIREMLGVL